MSNKFWVNSDYINEFTVLVAWISLIIPWNIQYRTLDGIGDLVFIRFPLFQIRYQLGFDVGQQNLLLHPYNAYQYQAGNAMAEPYLYWIPAAAFVALAFLYSLSLYFAEDRVANALPASPPRIMGGLLGAGTVFFCTSTFKLLTVGFKGINIPLGLAFMVFFTWMLLTNPTTDA